MAISPGAYIKITDQEFKDLLDFVYTNYGIDLSKKRHLIESRLAYTLKSRHIGSYSEYLSVLKSDKKDEVQFFLNKITTNHSYFAREIDHFNFLVEEALPALEKTRKGELRIWSAGCSSGQEAYNIAMAIDQYFGIRKKDWDTRILATDISTNVLQKAQEGIYAGDNLEGLPKEWISKYFNSMPGNNFQVTPQIRKEVVFRTSNLMEPFVFKKPFDIIFCRNVMIYFDFETTQNIVDKFYHATANGGYLFVGHSESIDKKRAKYEYVQPATFQRIK